MIRALEVFPQPRGPLNKYAWCVRPDSKAFESGTVTCSCPMTSANTEGRYLRYKANDIVLLLYCSSRLFFLPANLIKKDPSHTRQSGPTLAAFLPWGSSVR